MSEEEDAILRLRDPRNPGHFWGEDTVRGAAGDLLGGDLEKKGEVIFGESAFVEEVEDEVVVEQVEVVEGGAKKESERGELEGSEKLEVEGATKDFVRGDTG